MKISYLISCHNETDTLDRLLERVYDSIQYDDTHNNDEIVILVDSKNKYEDDINEVTSKILYKYTGYSNVKWHTHPLDADYGSHKNYGTLQCKGDYIFQIDGDELPSTTILGENLHSIIESNPEVELIFVPRINDYRGVKPEHAAQWGWRLTESPTYKRPLVNWPDFQGRIFKRVPDRIKWDRKLHEKIEGHTQYSFLPAEEDYAIYHDKTIEKQLETNIRYNKVFTKEDNMGHKVV